LFKKNAANAYRVSLTNCAVIDDLRRNCCLSDRSLRCFLSCFRCASAPFPRSFALTLPCVFACVVPLGGNPAGLLRGSRAWLIAATILHSSYFVSGCAKLIPYVLLCLVFCCSFVHVPFRSKCLNVLRKWFIASTLSCAVCVPSKTLHLSFTASVNCTLKFVGLLKYYSFMYYFDKKHAFKIPDPSYSFILFHQL